MSWVQVKSPNLNVQTSIGMCLKYVQDAYGSGWAGSYALQGWRDIVKKKHTNRNIPGGVYVPVWFEGYWNGVNYGHVAIYKDGICWSSPYTNKRSHDRLSSIQEVERIYGMKYIGWSEDIGGTTVIRKGDSGMIIQNQENWYWRCNKTHLQIRGRELARSTFKAYVGRDFLHFVEDCSDDKEADVVQNWQTVGKLAVQDKWQQQIYDLQAALKKAPSSAELEKAKKQAADLQAQMTIANKKAEAAEKKVQDMSLERIEAEKVGNAFILWLGEQLKKITGGK